MKDTKKSNLGEIIRNSGIIFAVLSALYAAINAQIQAGMQWLLGQFMTTATIPETDVLHGLLKEYLASHPSSNQATRFTAGTYNDPVSLRGIGVNSEKLARDRGDGTTMPEVMLLPGQTSYQFVEDGMAIKITLVTEANGKNWDGSDRFRNSFQVSVLGRRRVSVREFLQKIVNEHYRVSPREVQIFAPAKDGWKLVSTKRMRPRESVIMPDGVSKTIFDRIHLFFSRENWYLSKGMPYRLTLLFDGLKGGGKSSLIQGIAGEFSLNIYLLRMSSIYMDDEALEVLMQALPRRCLVAIEDADSAFRPDQARGAFMGPLPLIKPQTASQKAAKSTSGASLNNGSQLSAEERENREATRHGMMGMTLSAFLNSIDGITAPEGRILVLTTQDKGLLDSAILRKGRVDMEVQFTYADSYQCRTAFRYFYNDAPESAAEDFAASLSGLKISMSEVLNYLTLYPDDWKSAWENREAFSSIVLDNQWANMGGLASDAVLRNATKPKPSNTATAVSPGESEAASTARDPS